MCIAIGQQATLIMLPLYALEVGLGPTGAALVIGMRGLGTMLADVPSGIAVSRFGDRATMLGGALIVTLACAGFAFATSLWALSALGLILGIGFGVLMLGRLHYLTHQTEPHYRGRAITVLAGIQRAGLFIGPVAGGFLVDAFGFAVAFLGATVLTFAGLVLTALFMRFSARGTPSAGRGRGFVATARNIAWIVRHHRSIFTRAGLASVAIQFLRAARQLLIPLWGESIGLDAAGIGLAFGLSSALDAAMFYPAGWLMDFRGRKWALIPSLLVLSASLALLPFADSFWSYLAVALVSGLGNGFGTGVIMTMGADLAPTNDRAEFLGVWRLVGDVGHAGGPFVIGAVVSVVALGGALAFSAIIGVVGALGTAFFVTETLAARAPRREREEKPASPPPG